MGEEKRITDAESEEFKKRMDELIEEIAREQMKVKRNSILEPFDSMSCVNKRFRIPLGTSQITSRGKIRLVLKKVKRLK